MALPSTPPRYDSWKEMAAAIKLGDRGWRAFAVQTVVAVTPDGVWGPLTDKAVRAWQHTHGLVEDGIMGPTSQKRVLHDAGHRCDKNHGLPNGVGAGLAQTEGAGMLAATNWSVAGGVDCGAVQKRVLGPPFDMAELKLSFSPTKAVDWGCARLSRAWNDTATRNRHFTDDESLRVAALQHNWPAGADQIIRRYPGGGQWWRYVSSPDSPASWVPGFTRGEWCREYAARVLRFVA